MKVVAISGVSGCGKTSVVKLLAQRLFCPYLLFDEHTDDNTYPKDMKAWLQNGANVSAIKTPKMKDALEHLKASATAPFIFVEEPFGRCRLPMSSLVDYVVLLDMPMEVCLSRVIMRNLNHPSSDSLTSIPRYLSMYDDHFRDIYIKATEQVRKSSDLIITEVQSIESTADCIENWLQNVAH
ncbi:hypothetical protein [Thalassotalea fusca]